MLLIAGLLLGYFLTGALLSRLLLKRLDPGFSFLTSLLLITVILMFLNINRLPASVATVGGPLVVITLLLAAALHFSGTGILPRSALASASLRARRLFHVIRSRPLALALLVGSITLALAFIYKQWQTPIPGADVDVRWEYLAARAFEQGNFHFYPALTDVDYTLYMIPDAMGTMVAGGYWWAYTLAGSADVQLGAISVIAQMLLCLHAAWSLARALGASVTGSLLAVFILATTGTITTGVLLGQEMGFLILAALILMRLAVTLSPSRATWRTTLAMGLVCAASALSREHGTVLIAFALFACLRSRMGLWRTAVLLITFSLTAGVWLFYVWLLTGNPFYCLSVGSLFPRPPDLYARLLDYFQHQNLGFTRAYLTSKHAVFCLIQAIPGVLGLLALARLGIKGSPVRPRSAPWFLLVYALTSFAIACLAHISSPGGLYYSFRVFGPGLAISCVGLAVWASPHLRNRFASFSRAPIAASLATLCILAFFSHALLTILIRHDYAWLDRSQWLPIVLQNTRPGRDLDYQPVVRDMAISDPARFKDKLILTADVYLQRKLMGLPVRVLPPWSPTADVVNRSDISPLEARSILTQAGVGFVIIYVDSSAETFWQARSPWFLADQPNLYPRITLSPGVEVVMIPPPAQVPALSPAPPQK
jgi:hypothetical protein